MQVNVWYDTNTHERRTRSHTKLCSLPVLFRIVDSAKCLQPGRDDTKVNGIIQYSNATPFIFIRVLKRKRWGQDGNGVLSQTTINSMTDKIGLS